MRFWRGAPRRRGARRALSSALTASRSPGSCEPQASLSTRKGTKKVAVYDLTLTLAWEGYDEATDTSAKGELKVSEFASANDEDEFVWAATVEGKGAPHEALRKRVAGMRAAVVRDLLAIAAEMLNL